MRKTVCLILFLLAFILCGCSNQSETTKPTTVPTTIPSTTYVPLSENEEILCDFINTPSILGNVQNIIDGEAYLFCEFIISSHKLKYNFNSLSGNTSICMYSSGDIYFDATLKYYNGQSIDFRMHQYNITNVVAQESSVKFTYKVDSCFADYLKQKQVNIEAFIENGKVVRLEVNYRASNLYSYGIDPYGIAKCEKVVVNITDYNYNDYEIRPANDLFRYSTIFKENLAEVLYLSKLRGMVTKIYREKGYIDYVPDNTKTYTVYKNCPENLKFDTKLIASYGSDVTVETKEVTGVDYSTPGVYAATATCEYAGKEYSYTVMIEVVESDIEPLEIIQLDEAIKNLFDINNYSILVGYNKIYKFDRNINQIVGELDLNSQAQDMVLKENCLYVATQYTQYSTETVENMNGIIYLIDFEKFEVLEYTLCDINPYSIAVDNRNDLIISSSKRNNYKLYMMDSESKEISVIYNDYSIYEKAKLYYDSDLDIVLFQNQWATVSYIIFSYDATKKIYEETYRQESMKYSANTIYNDYVISNVGCIYKPVNGRMISIAEIESIGLALKDAKIHNDYLYHIEGGSSGGSYKVIKTTLLNGVAKTYEICGEQKLNLNFISVTDSYIYLAGISGIVIYENNL